MKKLIGEEISAKANNRQNAPSVVARLMGVDMLPSNERSIPQHIKRSNEKSRVNYSREECASNFSVGQLPLASNSARQLKSCHHVGDRDLDQWSGRLKNPRPREHPQEEELQKFKKEFQAWQASRFKECSKLAEQGSIPSLWLDLEKLNKEKRNPNENSRKMGARKSPVEVNFCKLKESRCGKVGLQHFGSENELIPAERKEHSWDRLRRRITELVPLRTCDQKLDIPSVPTKIVILRPGADSIGSGEESCASPSGSFEERDNIEDFLEEVKERLKYELQGKISKRGVVRGGGIETPYSENQSDPKQIAQHIAKKVRESVARDIEINFLRSTSTKSYSREIQLNRTDSPSFINRDARKILSQRLRNVLNGEASLDIPMVVHGSSWSSVFENRKGKPEKSGAVLNDEEREWYWDKAEDETNKRRSFRCGPEEDLAIQREVSPRNLIRSFSAPVSGASFGKKKHEAIEKIKFNAKKVKKEKFSIRKKVSTFKCRFSLRGRLFGRKIQLSEESHSDRHYFQGDVMSGPTVLMNFNDGYENSTEVPPSPASICSSVNEEFWRQIDYLSPATTPEIPPPEEDAVQQVFREISCNLNELRKQMIQLGRKGYKETRIEDQPSEPQVELEGLSESYIRDLLVASGLYKASSNEPLSRLDPFSKPINYHVFEEVEESYRKKTRYHERPYKVNGSKEVDHRILLDLLNEAVSTVLGPPLTICRFRKKVCPAARLPSGRELLDRVWKMICVYIYPSIDISSNSIDAIVSGDLQSTPWSELMDDTIIGVGEDMGSLIFSELIEETVKDMISDKLNVERVERCEAYSNATGLNVECT